MFFKPLIKRIKSRLVCWRIQLSIFCVAVCLRWFGVATTCRFWVEIPDPNGSSPQMALAKRDLAQLKRAVHGAWYKGNCLSRSIVLQRMLGQHDVSSRLHIGVRKKRRFYAHAWVEHDGVPLNAGKKVHQRYQSIEDYQSLKDAMFK